MPEVGVGLVAEVGAELPAKDRPILAASIARGAGRLVMGDRWHLGPLFGPAVGRTAIASPPAALGVLLEAIES